MIRLLDAFVERAQVKVFGLKFFWLCDLQLLSWGEVLVIYEALGRFTLLRLRQASLGDITRNRRRVICW